MPPDPPTPQRPAPLHALTADEPALLAAFRQGDPAAFERVVRESGPRLLAVATRILGNEDDARDALQDAFLSALKSVHAFDGRAKLSTWLHRVTVNAALMKLRARKRRPERDIDDFLPTFQSDGHAARPSAPWRLDRLADTELARLVRETIDQLPDRYRLVLILRDIEGLDTAAAAEAMQVSPNAIKILLHRARQALRELLDPRLAQPEPSIPSHPRPSP